MNYNFVCNTLTFESLNSEVETEVKKLCNDEDNTIKRITDCLTTFANEEYWDAPETQSIKDLTNSISEDLNTCREVLNSYLNLLKRTQEDALLTIKEIQNNIISKGSANSSKKGYLERYYREGDSYNE